MCGANRRLERAVNAHRWRARARFAMLCSRRTGHVCARPLKLIVRLPVDPYAVVLACIGYSAGAVGGYLLSKRIIRRLSSDSFKPRLVVWFGVAGGVVALLPAFFLSVVVGGTLGGSYGEVVGQTFGLGRIGVLIGIPVGSAVVLAALITVGVLAGTVLGRLIHSISSRDTAN
jgi:hypothetical protein